jgi:hypothetical protein
MWLVNATTLKLRQFSGSDIPQYSILSHTWGDEEVTFQELELPSIMVESKKGYLKVKQTCIRALEHGLQYAWIDTCCIDKTNSAELTESINSMFQWYKNAANCYVYLSDLGSGIPAQAGFVTCRRFTRGWTLQELIAPKELQFYNQEWQYIGSKADFSETIASITRINIGVLLGYDKPKAYSVASRMAWAAHRQTERMEDLAYCLLGIFDVNIPLIYGEGVRAFRRLQEEIIKTSNDLTIFAWDEAKERGGPCGLFAPSPAAFFQSDGIIQYPRLWSDPVFTLTNKGLRFEQFKLLWSISAKTEDSEHKLTRYSITLGLRLKSSGRSDFRMQLRKVGPGLFIRDGNLVEEPPPPSDSRSRVPMAQFYILTEMPDSSYPVEHWKRYRTVHFQRYNQSKL